MTDKSKRGTSASASKIAADGSGFSARLLKLTAELEMLCKDTDGLKDYGRLVDSQNALQKELQGKDQQLWELQKEIETLCEKREEDLAGLRAEASETEKFHERLAEEYNVRFKAWDAAINRHAQDAAELARLTRELDCANESAETAERESRSIRDKLNKQGKQLRDSQSSISTLSDKLKITELQLKQSQAELETCRKTLTTLKDDLGIVPLEKKKIQQKLEDLATRSHELVLLHFAKEIADPSYRARLLGEYLKWHRIPRRRSQLDAPLQKQSSLKN
ncbi:hypothetical protein GQ53DRAFT_770507 [Thozetella sp. PMI_491]|nr:hypothetical protein GQ53DRAFT_770507 [Thozetella sp. PMI_491]